MYRIKAVAPKKSPNVIIDDIITPRETERAVEEEEEEDVSVV